jgi:hypothetical protein
MPGKRQRIVGTAVPDAGELTGYPFRLVQR